MNAANNWPPLARAARRSASGVRVGARAHTSNKSRAFNSWPLRAHGPCSLSRLCCGQPGGALLARASSGLRAPSGGAHQQQQRRGAFVLIKIGPTFRSTRFEPTIWRLKENFALPRARQQLSSATERPGGESIRLHFIRVEWHRARKSPPIIDSHFQAQEVSPLSALRRHIDESIEF